MCVGREKRKNESLATTEQDGWRQEKLVEGEGNEEELRPAVSPCFVFAVRYDSYPVHCWPTNLDEQRERERDVTRLCRCGTGCRVNAFQIKGKGEA